MTIKDNIKASIWRRMSSPVQQAVADGYYAAMIEFAYQRARHCKASFMFNGDSYGYFCHRYNFAYWNERAVEIPIAFRLLDRYRGLRILEIGNVLGHYAPASHVVVDKFERAKGVLNVDLLDYEPPRPFDLVVSISTFEHIGFDENHYAKGEEYSDTQGNVLKAIEKVKGLLSAGGLFLLTLPLGYNPFLDEKIAANALGMPDMWFLKRVSRSNRWKQVSFEEVRGVKYAAPFKPGANGLVVAQFIKGGAQNELSEMPERP